jgi:catechol 2,3-dioxygenase-like lactoylglutathione lyase family enzyme
MAHRKERRERAKRVLFTDPSASSAKLDELDGLAAARDARTLVENYMLRDKDAVANLAVKDLSVAKKFYEGTLGFEPVGRQGDELIIYRSGKTTFNVYRSKEAGTNRATALTWSVGRDVKAVTGQLKAKGVTFEHYDMPGLTLEGDVHVGHGMQVAWFKDPDGNILNIVSG